MATWRDTINGIPRCIMICIMIWVCFKGKCGEAQPILTASTTLSYVCPGEDIYYKCSSNTSRIIWNAEPHVRNFFFLQREAEGMIGNPMQFMNIILEVTVANPLTTTLTIVNSNLLNETLVRCSTADNMIETIVYNRVIGTGSAPSNFELRNDSLSSGNAYLRVVNVTWNPYQNIVNYIIFCPSGECSNNTLNNDSTNAIFAVNSLNAVVVFLIAVNLCPSEPAHLELPPITTPEPPTNPVVVRQLTISTAVGWALLAVFLIIAGVGILIYLCHEVIVKCVQTFCTCCTKE